MASVIHIKANLVKDRGYWTVRARFRDSPEGKITQHSKSTGYTVSGNNKRKAEAAMRDIVAEWEAFINAQPPKGNPLFRDCVTQWLEHKQFTVRPNTLSSYKVTVEAHIIPKLGDIRICDLTRRDIQLYFEKLHREGISPQTMRKHRVVIHGTLEEAVLDGILSDNPAQRISLPKASPFEGRVLNDKEVSIMLHELERQPEPIRAAVTLALSLGLRRSEICGLRWMDVDFDTNTIHIRNTMTDYSGLICEGEATKTKASRRDLYLIPSVAEYLRSLKNTQEQNGIRTDKVCSHPDGHPVKPAYITKGCMRFLKQCGFDGVRLHDLRGTAATVLSKLVPIRQVKDYLGHEDIQTTLEYYVRTLSEDKIATANAMQDYLEREGFAPGCSGMCSGNNTESQVSTVAIPDNTVSIEPFLANYSLNAQKKTSDL